MADDISTPQGVIAPILTPFNDDRSLAQDLMTSLALDLLERGCVAVSPFGTTGEALSVAPEERRAALEALAKGGVPPERMMPGVGLCDLPSTIRLSRHALDLGCPAVMTLPPFYYKGVSEDGLFAYYAALIEALGADARILLYHIPQVAGVGLPVPLVQRLRTEFREAIVGIKDSSGDWANTAALLEIGDGFAVYPASETLLSEAMPLGAAGCVSATVNLNPDASARICAALAANANPDAADLVLTQSVRTLFAKAGFIGAQKRQLALASGDARWANVRPPQEPTSDADGRAHRAALAEIGFTARAPG